MTKTDPLVHQEAMSSAKSKDISERSERLRKVEASKQQLTWHPLTIDGKENIPAEVISY